MPTEPGSHLEAALRYAEQGLAVFPVWGVNDDGTCQCGTKRCKDDDSAGKHPITPRGLNDATTNLARIRAWWQKHPQANIGLATGEISGIVVLDVDGTEGFKSISGRPMPETPKVSTGRVDGGIHYYFKHPGRKVKNSVKKVGPGLDIRADGGYVILPPSRHKSGTRYNWAEPFDKDKLPDMPEWLMNVTDEKASPISGNNDTEGQIEKGGRNVFLTSVAGTLRRQGFSYATIRAALIEHNNEKCFPPLDVEEVERIAESISQKDYNSSLIPKVAATIFDELLGETEANEQCRIAPHNDVGNAEVFDSLYGDKFRYDHTRKKWMVWYPGIGVWREDFTNSAHRAMIATIRLRQMVAPSIQDDAERQSLLNFLHKAQNGKSIQNSLVHASSFATLGKSTADFDPSLFLLNTMNGTLDIENPEAIELKPHDPMNYITKQAGTLYDPTAKCPEWEKFIAAVFNHDFELINYIQRALGYSISGSTREQAIFIAHGNGANGKSTLLNTVKKVLGDYGQTTAFNTFDADNRNQYGNDLAALKSRRYVVAIEAEATKRLAEARVKSITGGDAVSCRFLWGEFFEFIPEFKVWLAVNHKPIIRGGDHGIWRRIHLVPFTQTFQGENQDKNLDQKLGTELSGILNWLIDGYIMWQRHGLQPPKIVQLATEEYREENDYVTQWINNRVTVESGEKMRASEGYRDFGQYLREIGEVDKAVPSMRVWGISMSEKGFEKKRTANGYEYSGLKLAEPEPLSATKG